MELVCISCFSHECHNDIIPLALFNLTILNTDSKLQNTSICSFLDSLLLHLLQVQIFPLVLFSSNTINQCSLLDSGQVSHPYKTRSKITETNSSLTNKCRFMCNHWPLVPSMYWSKCQGLHKDGTVLFQYFWRCKCYHFLQLQDQHITETSYCFTMRENLVRVLEHWSEINIKNINCNRK